MVNVVHVLATAEAIKRDTIKDLRFDMSTFYHKDHCGTSACIAGYAYFVKHQLSVHNAVFFMDVVRETGEWLGLDEDQRESLFHMANAPWWCSGASRRMAYRTLKHLASTGRVKWALWP